MKLANPLAYPLAILAGAVVLVAGVRFTGLPSFVVVPLAVATATGGAMVRKAQEPEQLNLGNPELERELQAIRLQAKQLADKTDAFRLEATQLLTNATQMDLLVVVQDACDRVVQLPNQIDQMIQRLQGGDDLLSQADLQQQLTKVKNKMQTASGVAKEHLTTLAAQLRRNLQLVKQGQDARQAQVANLTMLVTDAAGVLQALQNQLRTANFDDTNQTLAMRSLSDELSSVHENVNLLISR